MASNCRQKTRGVSPLFSFVFSSGTLFVFRPMLRRGLCYDINGAFKALPRAWL